MTRLTRTLVFAGLAPLLAQARSAPVLSGLYSVGDLGVVDFVTQDGKVTGKLKLPGVCSFPPDTTVISGVFEGQVLVASVMLCQDGESCPSQRIVPMLGFLRDDAVVGQIRLELDCTSPALDGKSLHIRPASVDEKKLVLGAENSAAQLAQRQTRVDPAVAAAQSVMVGLEQLEQKNYAQAREAFRAAYELDPRWESLRGIGLAELKLGHAAQALEQLNKAMQMAQRAKVGDAALQDLHYHRARALAATGRVPETIAALEQAVKANGAAPLVSALATDAEFNVIKNDPEYRRYYGKVRTLAEMQQPPRKKQR
jgi:hypothetical protein